MQKQKLAKIVFLILALILVLSLVFLLKGEKKDRTKNMYKKICSADNYTFAIEEVNSEKNKFIISKMGENKSLDLTSAGEHTTTLVKDGYAYFIMHQKEEYYLFENEDMSGIEANILEDDLDTIQDSSYLNGNEKIYGKIYYYEEYENIESFVMQGIPIEEDAKLNTRFYFDGDKIAYIKTIIDEEDEKREELLKIDLKFSTDEELFVIPNSYAELSFAFGDRF